MLFFIRHDFLDGLLKGGDAGLSHLLQLLLEAHREYQTYVVGGGIDYDVYARVFLGSHYYPELETVAEKNEYRKAYSLLEYLLVSRKRLARESFAKADLTDEDVRVLLTHLVEGHTSISQCKRPSTRIYAPPQLNCKVREEDMWILAECAKEAHLFTETTTSAVMSNLMRGKLEKPLHANEIISVAYFFDQLCAIGLVHTYWQRSLENDKAILLRDRDKPHKATNYSSALNRGKAGYIPYKDVIDACVQYLKDKYKL